MLFAISITFIHPCIPPSLHPLFPKAMKCFLAVQEEMKSLARRHPEEEKGLNIIICVVVVSLQLIKVSAKGSCSTFSHVLFLLPGSGGWAEGVQVLEKDTLGSVVLLSSLQCHLSQGLKLVHFRNSMLKEWSTLCSPICYFSSFLGFPLCSLFKFRMLILPPRPSTRYIPPSHLQMIQFILPRTEDLQTAPNQDFLSPSEYKMLL